MAGKQTTRISYSSVNDFKECPTKMYNKKKYSMIKQSSALAFGSAIEAGVEALLTGNTIDEAIDIFHEHWHTRPANKWEGARQIFDSEDIFYYASDYDKNLLDVEAFDLFNEWYREINIDPPKDYFKFVGEIQTAFKKEEEVTDEDRRLYHRIMWYCVNTRGPYMIEAFARDIMPNIEELLSCQKDVLIKNKDGDKVTGFIDFIAKYKDIKGPVVWDLKSAGRFYESHNIDSSDQLRVYAVSEDIRTVGYWVLIKSLKHKKFCTKCDHERAGADFRKKNCTQNGCKGKYEVIRTEGLTQVLTKTLTQADVDDVMEDFSEILMAIKNGLKWKNANSCFNYGTKCEFYDNCWAGKALSELKHLKKR